MNGDGVVVGKNEELFFNYRVSVLPDEKSSSGDCLHNNVNALNTA